MKKLSITAYPEVLNSVNVDFHKLLIKDLKLYIA